MCMARRKLNISTKNHSQRKYEDKFQKLPVTGKSAQHNKAVELAKNRVKKKTVGTGMFKQKCSPSQSLQRNVTHTGAS